MLACLLIQFKMVHYCLPVFDSIKIAVGLYCRISKRVTVGLAKFCWPISRKKLKKGATTNK